MRANTPGIEVSKYASSVAITKGRKDYEDEEEEPGTGEPEEEDEEDEPEEN